MEIFGFNKVIACAPPTKVDSKKAEFNGGLPMIHQRYALVPLTVIYGNGEIPAKSTVFVAPESLKGGTWAQTVYDLDYQGEPQSVILVPTEFVKLLGFPE